MIAKLCEFCRTAFRSLLIAMKMKFNLLKNVSVFSSTLMMGSIVCLPFESFAAETSKTVQTIDYPATVIMSDEENNAIEIQGTVRKGKQLHTAIFSAKASQIKELNTWTKKRINKKVLVRLVLNNGKKHEFITILFTSFSNEMTFTGVEILDK